tara:strand:- start:2369 stop:2665 length:297 start_codon:yes stop_codon:yes gene_type:complete
MVKTMNKEQLTIVLQAFFDESISRTSAWLAYCNFNSLLEDGDKDTIEYFLKVVEMDRISRLKLRNTMAEQGNELTPHQLDQYIFLLLLSLNRYIEQII